MEHKNEIQLERKNDIMVMHIQGDITSHSEPYINGAYQELNDRENVSKILIQFEQEAYINSGGIAVLIQILAQTQKNNQQIAITGLSEHFKKIFNMVGITKFAHIYDGVEEALESMSTA
jgi:anti-anti-sigma factor